VVQFQTFAFKGCRLAYRIVGKGPPLVMIQGAGAYGLGWNPQVEILAKHYTCLTFDNRGVGKSQPAGMPLSVEQMAADVDALMDQIGWHSAHIVGHSLGGLVALELALTDKSRIRSLALLCTFARGADARHLTLLLVWIILRIRFGPRRLRRQAFLDLVLPPGQRAVQSTDVSERIAAVFGHDIGDVPPITNRQLAAMTRHDVTPRLGELSGIPTLVISGDKDLIARPTSGRIIAAGIRSAKYIEIAGASHAFPVLEAERCGALLLQHLAAADSRNLQSA
jgi:pimeloyl-ACP methyl ester carboxylesterase